MRIFISALAASIGSIAFQITVNNRGTQVGWLHPENWPLIPAPCGNSRGVFISLGNTILPADKWPKTVLVLAGEPVITLDRNEKGEIAITEDVFNQNDDIVVAIEKNKYKISDEAFDVETDPPNSNNPTRLQVIVKHNKEKVLDIEYLNKTAVVIYGHFYRHGTELSATKTNVVVTNATGPKSVGGDLICSEGSQLDF